MTAAPLCTGRGGLDGSHCCWVNGVRCQYLEEDTVPGRNFVCGLRRALGSWEAVHADPGYIENVQRFWDVHPNIASCGEWQPEPGMCCRET